MELTNNWLIKILISVCVLFGNTMTLAHNKVVVIPLGAEPESIIGATVPSGTTISGYYMWDQVLISDNGDYQFTVNFPAYAPVALTDQDVNFETHILAGDGDASCTGTEINPTASAGKVCIYLSGNNNVDNLQGFPFFLSQSQKGFIIYFLSDGTTLGADMFLHGTWAYTAP